MIQADQFYKIGLIDEYCQNVLCRFEMLHIKGYMFLMGKMLARIYFSVFFLSELILVEIVLISLFFIFFFGKR